MLGRKGAGKARKPCKRSSYGKRQQRREEVVKVIDLPFLRYIMSISVSALALGKLKR